MITLDTDVRREKESNKKRYVERLDIRTRNRPVIHLPRLFAPLVIWLAGVWGNWKSPELPRERRIEAPTNPETAGDRERVEERLFNVFSILLAALAWLVPREHLTRLTRRRRKLQRQVEKLLTEAQSPLWRRMPPAALLQQMMQELEAIRRARLATEPDDSRRLDLVLAITRELYERFGSVVFIDSAEMSVLLRARIEEVYKGAEFRHG
jgi:hypothetical protein